MIRLNASEITLTPAHVEETRRRMERRQAANPPATLPARFHGPSLPPTFRPRLKRGPIRARDESITTLGNIPILRPQQAVHSFVDDSGDLRDSLAGSSEAVSSGLAASPLLGDQTVPVPLPDSELQLPFRLAHQDRDSTLAASQGDTSEDTPSPSKGHLSPPRLGRARTNSSEPGNDDLPFTRDHTPTDGHVDNAPSLETPMRNQVRSFHHHSTQAQAPLQGVERITSRLEGRITGNGAGQTTGNEQQAPEASSPARFIRGYWDSHQRYNLRECASQTEPRPRTAQPFRRNRAMSSSSEPSHQPRVMRPDTSESSTAGDVFWNTPAPEPPSIHDDNGLQRSSESSNDRYWSPLGMDGMGYGDPIRNTSGRHSSGASTTSQPYSFYELPDSSRHSSSTYPQPETLAQSQYDGAAPSRQVSRELSRGAYYSIRLPQTQAASGAFLRPAPPLRVPSTSSPDLAALGQYGPSPLPSRPYSKMPSAQHRLIPSTGLINVADFVGGDQDAARAVQRDLSSPLELVQERANAYLERISARVQAASSQTQTTEPRASIPGYVEEVTNLSRVIDRQRRDSGIAGSWHESDDNAHGRNSARPRARMDYAPIPVPGAVDDPTLHVRVSQVPRRTVPAARATQRSSENAPVGLSAQEMRSLRSSGPRASLVPPPTRTGLNVAMRGGELSTTPATARFSIPQVQQPRDVSNRPHIHSPYPALLLSDGDPSGSDTLTPVPSTASRLAPPAHQNPIRGPRIPSRYGSRQDLPSDAPQRQPTRRAVTPIPTPLPFSGQFERGLPSTSTTLDSASGVTSRRTQVARAATRRQIMNERENTTEDRERQGMRGEAAGVEWRFSEEGRMDIMEETPPRLGRHERFMYE
ncbi:hypothetical protein P171DRAFT_517236 [Karstenula rhodostoma CBS 690.94]|uniref:Uncharacterized protein n=1 Tax=Karstenula rhodostoma CBS 690.94 TaxID=1392251 RepID=A0A9P4PUG4_9PLEO|nr:hypothetical protein P171DRAFT_517236 [Karstenula rhodostoma CBS 690.94]